MSFARFMELALYAPDGGYYRAPTARPGRDGDFITAPELHPIFGATIATGSRRSGDGWASLRRSWCGSSVPAPAPWPLGILDGLRDAGSPLLDSIVYEPVEVDPRRLDAFASRLADAGHGDRQRAPDGGPMVGVILGNEVLDALPVHRVRRRDGALREIAVDVGADGRLEEVELDVASEGPVATYLADAGIELVDGQTAELSLSLGTWIAGVASDLARGVLLLIDYGAPAAELYDPVRRRDGTLRAYVRHQVHDDPYRHVGRQDLTAHVDVTAVERAAHAAGLTTIGITTQAEALDGSRHRGTAAGDPGRPGDDVRGVHPRPLRAHAPAGSGGDGPVPGDGLRPRLAGRRGGPPARPLRVPASGPSNRASATRRRRPGGLRLGNMPYCGRGHRRVTLPLVVHSTTPPEEWGAILHARSARSAPLAGVASSAAALGGVATRPGWKSVGTNPSSASERRRLPALATPVDPCPLLE